MYSVIEVWTGDWDREAINLTYNEARSVLAKLQKEYPRADFRIRKQHGYI